MLPGQCRQVGPQATRLVQYWDTVRIARTQVLDDLEEATASLHRTAVACVAAWASRFRHIAHRLSGGLDSSIVLGCLTQAAPRAEVTGLHYCVEAVDSEERRYAVQAAEHAGISLIQRPIVEPTITLERMAQMPATALPMGYHYGLGVAPFEAQLAQQTGADGFFSGHGGDEVLGASNTQLSAVDYVRRHRLGSSLLRFAMDAALLSRTSLWSVLGVVLRHGVLKRPCDPAASFSTPGGALAAALEESIGFADILHPLLDRAALPPGKFLHVFAIHAPYMNATLAPLGDRVDQVYPLHSQPLVELCLRVPTYLLSIGGRNRGLARAAFAGVVPSEILARNSKASGDQYHDKIARDNARLIRDYVLDGLLVERGLLDRSVLMQIFHGDHAELSVFRPQLLTYLYAEDWARRWA